MLIDQINRGSGFEDAALKLTNTTGTPVATATDAQDGRGIVDNYYLTFDTVIAGVSANVTVDTASPNNPYKDVTFAVDLDGVTEYKDIIPGVILVFDDDGGFLDTWEATILLGNYLGAFAANGATAGIPTAGVRHRVENDSANLISGAKARLLTLARWVKKTGRVFETVKPFAEDAVEKTVGGGSNRITPYVFTISAVAGSGGAKTCSVSVDAVIFPANSLKNLNTGVTQDGTNVKAISPGEFYEVVLGDLTGLIFSIDAAVANGNTANVLIFESRFLQIAEDTAGVAGSYGVADVDLTETGETTGTITPGGFAYYWLRVLVPDGSNTESNPYQADVTLEALEGGAANWLA